MGIGTLIVFIAGILVATISAGVTLTTQSRLQNKALEVSGKVKEGVSVNFQTVDVKVLKNSYDENFGSIILTMKLAPGSGDVRLNRTLIDIIQDNSSGIYRYIGNNSYYVNKNNRLIQNIINSSWIRLHSDLDFDFVEDFIRVYNSTLLQVNLSSVGIKDIIIANISSPGQTFNNNYTIGSEVYGELEINGTTTTSNEIDAGMLRVKPYSMYNNYGGYTVEQIINELDHLDGILVDGDVFKIYIETTEPLLEDSEVTISIKKETGHIHRLSIALPSVMVGDRIKVYP